MAKKTRLMAMGIVIVVVLGVISLRKGPRQTRFDPKAAALVRLEEVRGEGLDLSKGPCLGLIGPDWVADVAHDPRQPVDDDPANQCAEYRTGEAKHFVELTDRGKIILVK